MNNYFEKIANILTNILKNSPEYRTLEKMYNIAGIYSSCESELDNFSVSFVFESNDIYWLVITLQNHLATTEKVWHCIAERIINKSTDSSTLLAINSLNIAILKIRDCCYALSCIEKKIDIDIWKYSIETKISELSKLLEGFDDMETQSTKRTLEEFLGLSDNAKISFNDFLVRTNVFHCNKHHSIETINAIVEIMQKNGTVSDQTISAGYCKECNTYFILESDYLALKKCGIILCQQLTYEVYRNKGNSIMNGSALKPESLLHQCGYNVSSTENLSREQRREILRRVVDGKLYSISGLCSHLDWLIDRNSRATTKDMSTAISKWKEDREYIASYSSKNARVVGVNSITKKL